MKCKHCGKAVRGTPQVCPHCGAPMSDRVSLGAINAAHAASHRKKKKKRSRGLLALYIAIGVVGGLLLLMLAGIGVMWGIIEGNVQKGEELSGDLGINSELPTEGITNIALFGLDTRDNNQKGHSDAIIIVSIDRTHNKIKMSSIARDSLVPIEGHGKSKITHAFGYGGVSLAVKTLNKNFGMNIQDYAFVNFYEFAEIVDLVGGVEIDVSRKEMGEMNHHIKWIRSYGIPCENVKQPGVQRLNGGQALAYARVRKIDSDLERSNRQKEVLQALFNEVKKKPSTVTALVPKVLQMCHTNMSSSEIMSISTWALTSQPTIETLTLPTQDTKAWGGVYGQYGWVWIYDLRYATAQLHDFIYETDAASGINCTRFNGGGSGGGQKPANNTTAPKPTAPTAPKPTAPTGTGSGMTGTQTGSGQTAGTTSADTGTQTGSGQTTGAGSTAPMAAETTGSVPATTPGKTTAPTASATEAPPAKPQEAD